MNHKRTFRSLILLLMAGILLLGLASCKLPASKGPQTSSDGFPVPSTKTQTPISIDVSKLATQTAQALPPTAILTQATLAPSPTIPQPYPMPTNTPLPILPTNTPETYVQPTPGTPPITYTLAEGEYPFCIARRFNVDQNELYTLNGLTQDSLYYAGQVLQIPQTGNPFIGQRALHPHPTTYQILPGDTLDSIACYFGDVSPDMIALQNGLKSPELTVGEVLIIP